MKRIIPKVPKGTRDIGSHDIFLKQKLFDIITNVLETRGAEPMDTPIFELTNTFKQLYGEESKLIYNLEDQGGEQLSLRYDLTVPLARYIGSNGIRNFKRYQIGKVYRRESPSLHRYREFYQCDFDIIGGSTPLNLIVNDVEILDTTCIVFDKIFDFINKEFNQKFDYKIKFNDRRILADLLDHCNVSKENFSTVCSSIDKLDKHEWEYVKDELLKVKNIDPLVVAKIKSVIVNFNLDEKKNPLDVLQKLYDQKIIKKDTLDYVQNIFEYLDEFKILGKIDFDISMVRGLDYYTGIIFEIVLDNDDPNLFTGSIGGGGRYDKMISKFVGQKKDIPSIGISFGIERIISICNSIKINKINRIKRQVYIASVGKKMLKEKVKLCRELWIAGIKADYNTQNNAKIGNQLNYVFENKIPLMIVIGENEIEKNVVQLKYIEKEEQIEYLRKDIADVIHKFITI